MRCRVKHSGNSKPLRPIVASGTLFADPRAAGELLRLLSEDAGSTLGGNPLSALDVGMGMSSSRRLPVVVDVPDPCEVDWEDMQGDERARHCGQCGKTVRNLSVLDGDEIADVLAHGDCVSFLYRDDASVITAESAPVGVTGIGAKAAVVLAATMALTLGCKVQRMGGAPPSITPVAVATVSSASPQAAGAAGAASQGGVEATGAAPVQSGVPSSGSVASDPAASCAPGSKSTKDNKRSVPSEQPRRTAGVPLRRKE